MITAQLVKELRDATNLGILDCKKALEATNGNIDAAIDWLREKGIAKAAKKESRIAAEGLANIYVSGNKAVILEVNSETDFVAQNEDFKKMVDEICKRLHFTSLRYHRLDDMIESVGIGADRLCTYCWNGEE